MWCVHIHTHTHNGILLIPTRDWARPAFECLLAGETWVSSAWGQGLWLQQIWEEQSVASVLLEEVAISSTMKQTSRGLPSQRTITPKKFSRCCESSRAHNKLPSLDIQQKDWEPPGKHSRRAQQNLVCTWTQEKETVTPRETEPDLPVSVWESPAELWADVACCRVGDTDYNSPGSHGVLVLSTFEGGHLCHHYPTIVWPLTKLQGGNTAPPISRKLD